MDESNQPSRSWQVLLIGGASGTGKTSVSYRLAHHFRIGITEVDDFQSMLLHMIDSQTIKRDQLPYLHNFYTHAVDGDITPEALSISIFEAAFEISSALEAVIARHLQEQIPVVLEGHFILPSLAAQSEFCGLYNNGQVRSIFLHEPELEQLRENQYRREPESGKQELRARATWDYGDFIKRDAEKHHLTVIPARPWGNIFERVLSVLG